MTDLFESPTPAKGRDEYSAEDIVVLEGLEPVRKRPGMYIGGTDERALHHLASEILDNAMDEAVAGYATRIEIELGADGYLTIRDNGRGIPVDEHSKFPGKSALEVIMTTLHSGGKFGGGAYKTSGGLHGVGISVVNALADDLEVEVARDKELYRQCFSRGTPKGPIEKVGAVSNRRGTTVRFHPDPDIFGEKAAFKPERLYKTARSKAYLFHGVEIRWKCDPELLAEDPPFPGEETFHFPNGLLDFINGALEKRATITPNAFSGKVDFPDDQGRVEFAVAWPMDENGFISSYCNTVPTPQGGTHENGLRNALTRSLRGYGEMTNVKKAGSISADDVMGGACVLLSIFIRDPQFQGQTKDKLATSGAARLVETAVKDYFDHWLTSDPSAAHNLLERVIERADERHRAREKRATARKTATRRLRLPGKLADCSDTNSEDTEIFIVEGDSAGGSAKQARNRNTQAILPLRGKILNVASATAEKLRANQELNDLTQALGCGMGKDFNIDKLRYERVIIMTDADVDGAHIASLLITFFYKKMRNVIEEGRLFLAMPPLYRLSGGGKVLYARDDAHKDELMKTDFSGRTKVEISRFKGLGEMPAKQLKETTMDPEHRSLMRVTLPEHADHVELEDVDDLAPADKNTKTPTALLIEQLMGKNPEHRYDYIQQNAEFARDLDI